MDILDAVKYNPTAILTDPSVRRQVEYNIFSGSAEDDLEDERARRAVSPISGGERGPMIFGLGALGQAAMGAVSGALGGMGFSGSSGIAGRRRRRRKTLTAGQRADLLFIKDAVGKTAAANYLNLLRRG